MKRILIDRADGFRRIALIEDDRLTELLLTRDGDGPEPQAGDIVLGRVAAILPNQTAFVDIGGEKNALMNLPEDHGLQTGQPLPVEVRKDASGGKGATVSPKLLLHGRLALLSPHGDRDKKSVIGVSQKITDAPERARLRSVFRAACPPGFDAVARTNSAYADSGAIREEIDALTAVHARLRQQAAYVRPPARLYRADLSLSDLLTDDVDEVWVDGEALFANVQSFIRSHAPALSPRVFRHGAPSDILAAFGMEKQAKRALSRAVRLPCGGYVTIEPTEACVVIDVNSGRFSGKGNYGQSARAVNLEAAECVAAQLRLRNLSGLIVVDFIDPDGEEDRRELQAALEAFLRKDRIKSEVVGLSAQGLAQVTRRRAREPLHRLLGCTCPHCGGLGWVRKGEEKRDEA